MWRNILLLFSCIYFASASVQQEIEEPSLVCNISGTCYNGGYWAPTGCQCPTFTYGSCCEVILCQNHGILTGNYCKCPPGWYSRFCERRSSTPHLINDLDFSKRSFVVVINSVETMLASRDAIVSLMNSTLSQIDPATISNYVLKYYLTTEPSSNSLDTMERTTMTTNRDDFMQDIMTNWITSSNPISLTQETMKAVSDLQYYSQASPFDPSRLEFVSPKSTIFIFTDRAEASGVLESYTISDLSMEHRLIEQTLLWRNRPVIFFMQTSAPVVNIQWQTYAAYRRYAEATNGELIRTQESEVAEIMLALPYFWKNEFLVSYAYTTCDNLTIGTNLVDNANVTQYMLISVQDSLGPNSTYPVTVSQRQQDTGGFPLMFGGHKWMFYILENGSTEYISAPAQTVCSVKVFIQSDVSFIYSISDAPHADTDSVINYNATSKYIVAQYIPVLDSNIVFDASVVFTNVWNDDSFANLNGNPTTNASTLQILFDSFTTCKPGPYLHRFNVQLASGRRITRIYPGYCSYPATSTQVRADLTSKKTIAKPIFSDPQCPVLDVTAYNQPRFNNYRQIVFAIELTKGMKDIGALQSLITMVPNLIRQIGSVEGTYFTLITFTDQSIFHVTSDYSVGNFIDVFMSTLSVTSPRDNGNNGAYSSESVLEAIKLRLVAPTQVNIFTRSKSIQGSNDFMLPRDVQVNFYVVSSTVDVDIPKRTLQKQSGGRLISVGVNDIENMQALLYYSTQENSMLQDTGKADCSVDYLTTILIPDNYMNSTSITAYGNNVNILNVIDDSGNPVPYIVLLDSPNSVVFQLDTSKLPGALISANISTSSGACYMQANGISQLNFALGFTEDTNTMATIPFSRRGTNASVYVTAHSNMAGFKILTFSVLPTYFNTPWFDTYNETSSSLYSRSQQCGYQYITNNIQMPLDNGLKMFIQGQQPDNTIFERIFFYYTPLGDHMCGANPHDVYGQCICDLFHYGEFCERPVCQNGGSESKEICICTTGYYGDFCENNANGPAYSTPKPTTTTSSTSTTTTTSSTTTTAATSTRSIFSLIITLVITHVMA